jgi:hypothetical protein
MMTSSPPTQLEMIPPPPPFSVSPLKLGHSTQYCPSMITKALFVWASTFELLEKLVDG